jgi:signal transduction histidine kinase
VQLAATTNGAPVGGPDPARPHYGIVGMRERAVSLGGELEAGPVDGGWCVSCRIPLGNGDES